MEIIIVITNKYTPKTVHVIGLTAFLLRMKVIAVMMTKASTKEIASAMPRFKYV